MKEKNNKDSKAKFIVCPHCNATEFSVDENGMGKCAYCGATFIVHTTETVPKNSITSKSETPTEYVCHVDLSPKPEKPAKNAYGHTEDKSFDKAIKTSFVKFLPLWISTWLSLIYSIIVFSVCIKYDLAYTNNDLALALNIVSIVLTPSLLTASATCTLLKAKRIFLQKDYELLEKISAEKSLTKKETVFKRKFRMEQLCGRPAPQRIYFWHIRKTSLWANNRIYSFPYRCAFNHCGNRNGSQATMQTRI